MPNTATFLNNQPQRRCRLSQDKQLPTCERRVMPSVSSRLSKAPQREASRKSFSTRSGSAIAACRRAAAALLSSSGGKELS